jgi:hypothetical protein
MAMMDWRDSYAAARQQADTQARLLRQAIANHQRIDPDGPLVAALTAIDASLTLQLAMLDQLRSRHVGIDG